MPIEPLDDREYWKATIKWNPARKWYKDGEDAGVYLAQNVEKEYGIYRFERRHGNQVNSRDNLYIGIAFKQNFNTRLHQGFHDYKIKKAKKGEIWVSVGTIDLKSSKHYKNRYEEIESILIYYTQPTLNKKKKEWSPASYFEIENKGHRGPLPKYIKYPVAEVYY